MFQIDAEILISLVESKPVLWDKTIELFKDRNAKRNAWSEVCLALEPNFNTMENKDKNLFGQDVISKWGHYSGQNLVIGLKVTDHFLLRPNNLHRTTVRTTQFRSRCHWSFNSNIMNSIDQLDSDLVWQRAFKRNQSVLLHSVVDPAPCSVLVNIPAPNRPRLESTEQGDLENIEAGPESGSQYVLLEDGNEVGCLVSIIEHPRERKLFIAIVALSLLAAVLLATTIYYAQDTCPDNPVYPTTENPATSTFKPSTTSSTTTSKTTTIRPSSEPTSSPTNSPTSTSNNNLQTIPPTSSSNSYPTSILPKKPSVHTKPISKSNKSLHETIHHKTTSSSTTSTSTTVRTSSEPTSSTTNLPTSTSNNNLPTVPLTSSSNSSPTSILPKKPSVHTKPISKSNKSLHETIHHKTTSSSTTSTSTTVRTSSEPTSSTTNLPTSTLNNNLPTVPLTSSSNSSPTSILPTNLPTSTSNNNLPTVPLTSLSNSSPTSILPTNLPTSTLNNNLPTVPLTSSSNSSPTSILPKKPSVHTEPISKSNKSPPGKPTMHHTTTSSSTSSSNSQPFGKPSIHHKPTSSSTTVPSTSSPSPTPMESHETSSSMTTTDFLIKSIGSSTELPKHYKSKKNLYAKYAYF